MHPLAQKYINAKKLEYSKKIKQERKDFLLSEGLFEKKYAPNGEYDSSEYPEYEWDETTKESKYFKFVPIEVTDEEYEQIKKANQLTYKTTKTNKLNPIYVTLVTAAILIFVSTFISGSLFATETYSGYYYTHTDFHFDIALIYWGIGCVSGIFFLALAEIIRLLDKKYNDN